MTNGIKLKCHLVWNYSAREMNHRHSYLRPLEQRLLPLQGRRLDGLPPLEHRGELVCIPRAHLLKVCPPLALLLLTVLLRAQGLK